MNKSFWCGYWDQLKDFGWGAWIKTVLTLGVPLVMIKYGYNPTNETIVGIIPADAFFLIVCVWWGYMIYEGYDKEN